MNPKCFRPLTGMVHEQEMADARVRCFRPLTGMVLSSRIYKRSPVQFSPPYEDGTDIESALDYLTGFSPPYGDGTVIEMVEGVKYPFSPTYGDGTLNISQNIVKWKN